MVKKSEKKDLAIVFGITKNYVFALANVLIGMKKHHRKPIWNDIIVYHDGISEADKDMLSSILKCNFIDFNAEELKECSLDKHTVNIYSLLVLSRFYCFDLLKDYKKVIWHDVDILIQSDFSGLLEYGEKSGFALTLTDSDFLVESNFYKPIPGYSMYSFLFNAGIMVLSDKLQGYESFTKWCFDKTCEVAANLRYMDQGVLNLLIQDFNIDVERIDILKYCCHPSRTEYKTAPIIHAYGINKFWNSDKLEVQFPEWKENNEAWLSIKRKYLSKEEDKISVIMSVYNRADYLIESIESILNQTYQNFEIIIVVEYSEQQQKINDIIKSVKDNRIVIINNDKKLGFPASLNVGIDKSTGKYIARMDDDDISEPERFERQVDYFRNNPEIGICGTYIQCFGKCNDKWSYVPTDPEECKIQLLFCTSLYHPTVMMRRSVIKKNKLYYDPSFFTEDYELWSRAIKYTKISSIPEYLLRYRTSGQNITSNNSEKVHNFHIAVMKKQFKEYLKLDLSFDELQLVNKRINIVEHSFNYEHAAEARRRVYKKILRANEAIGFYKQEELIKYLGLLPERCKGSGFRALSKKAIKILLGPVRNKLNLFVIDRLWGLDKRIADIEARIDAKK